MPFRRKFRRFPRKRRFNRRKASSVRASSGAGLSLQRRNAVGRSLAITGFPQMMKVIMPYGLNTTITPGAVSSNDYQWTLNGGYDPDITIAGHQPRGWDVWTTVYQKYRVTKVEVQITIRQRAAHGIQVFLVCNNSTSSLTGVPVLQEYAQCIRMGVTSSNVRPLTKKLTLYPHKVIGKTYREYCSDENTQALISANPAELAVLHVVVQQVDGTTALDYEAEYSWYIHCTFFDPTDPPIS